MMVKAKCFWARRIALFVLFFFLCGLFPQYQISATEQQWPRHMGGNFRYQQQDIKILSPGFDLLLVRTYNSQSRFRGIFGWGWTCEYDLSVFSFGTPSQLFVREADGSVFMLRHAPDKGFYYSKRNGWQTVKRQADGSYVRTLKGGRQQYFDAKGRLKGMADLNGSRLSLAYSKEGRLTEVVSSTGRALRLGYDPKGDISRLEDPLGRVHSYQVDDSGNLAEVKDPEGRTTSFRYDQSHKLVEIRYPDGSSKKLTYNTKQDVLLREAGPGPGETTYDYDYGSRTMAVTDAAGNTSRITYSADGMTRELTDPLGARSRFVYGEDGLLLSFQDAAGGRTTFEYDDQGLLKSATDPLGSTERFEYHPSFSIVTSYTNRAGGRYEFQYDQRGNLTLIIRPDGSTERYQYTTQGFLSERIGADGFRTRYSYDRNGYPVKAFDDIGTLFEAAYDNAGQVVRGGMTGNPIYSFQYSLTGKVTQMSDSGRRLYRYTYDAMDRLVSIVDPDKHETYITYDQAGRITAVQDALRHKTQFAYGASGRLVQLTDANGNVTRYRVDANGRIVEREDAGQNRVRLSYDAAGNISSATDAKGQTVTFSRDRSGQVMERHYPDGSRVAFAYDPLGNITSVKEAAGRMAFAYDKMGRIVSKQDERTGRMILYTYDQSGRLVQKATSDGHIFRYGYDGRNRMTSILDPLGGRTEYQYDGADRRSAIIYPNGTVARYVYDELGRFTEVRHQGANGKTFVRVVYTADHGDRFASVTVNDGPARSYTYDAIGQLVRESILGGETIAYRYDPVGNRIEAAGAETKRYLYDRLNRLIRAGEAEYTYDANGHLVRKTERGSETRFTYDFEGRMTGVDLPGGEAYRYEYNALGERVARSGPHGRKLYIHDGEDVLAEFGGDRRLERLYLHGPGIDDIAGLIQGGARYTVHADAAGSTMAVLDDRQEPASRYEYGSFGEVKKMTERVNLPFLYTGARYDAESGFHYLRTRAYDPAIGRFVSPDVIDIAGDINLYRYVINNPVNYIDPAGTLLFTTTGAVVSTSVSAIRATLQGGSAVEIWAAACGGFVSGVIAGAAVDITIATAGTAAPAIGTFVVVSAGSSALGSAAGTATEQTLVNQYTRGESKWEAFTKVSKTDVAVSAGVSAVTGGIAAKVGGVPDLPIPSGGRELATRMGKEAGQSFLSEVPDEALSTGMSDWALDTKGAMKAAQEATLRQGMDYLNGVRNFIISSKAYLSDVNQYAGVMDSLATAVNVASRQAQKAQGAVSSAKATVNSARSACLNAPAISEIKAARDVVVKAAAEIQSLKERAIKASVRACTVADQRNREKDSVAKSRLDMEAKNLTKHAEHNFWEPAQKAYLRVKGNADKVLALEQKLADATGKAEAARSALDNAQIEVNVAVKLVRHADDGLRMDGPPTIKLAESAIRSGMNSRNAALDLLAKVNREIIPNLETGTKGYTGKYGDDTAPEEREGLQKQMGALVAEATRITFPEVGTIKIKFDQAKGTHLRAKAAADQASSALSNLKEALKPCEAVDSTADIVRDAMGAADAAHRSLQITDNVISKAKECAKLPQTASKEGGTKSGTGSAGEPSVIGKLPPPGADPFVGTWALRLTAIQHSNPDAMKEMGSVTETGRMMINRSGNRYSVTGLPGMIDTVSVSGETITIKGRQSEGGGRYDLFTMQLTLRNNGRRLEGQMRWDYISEIRPPGVPAQWSINSVVGTRQ